MHRRQNVLDHVLRALLRLRSKVARDVFLAERVAEQPIGGLGAALPARLELLGAFQVRAVKSKVLLHEGIRESVCEGMQKLPLQVGSPVGERCLADLQIDLAYEFRLTHVEVGAREPRVGKIPAPVDSRRELREFREGHLVIDGARVAQRHIVQGSLGQALLDPKHRGRGPLSLRLAIAGEPEHPPDVGPVALAGFLKARLGLEVVIAIGKPEPAGVDGRKRHRGVVVVGR